MSVNKVIIVGNLGADPEVRYTQSGTAVTNMRIATNEVWTDKSGQRQERTEWHRVVVWGKQGEQCAEYLSKGRTVYLEGRLQTREWTDKEGRKQWTTEIVADRVVFLSTGQGGARRGQSDEPYGAPPPGFDEGSGGYGGGGYGGGGGGYGGGGGGYGGGGQGGGGPSEDDIPF